MRKKSFRGKCRKIVFISFVKSFILAYFKGRKIDISVLITSLSLSCCGFNLGHLQELQQQDLFISL